MKTLDLEKMGVKEMDTEEKINIDGGNIINDIANAVAEGIKWNLRAMSWGLYQLSE